MAPQQRGSDGRRRFSSEFKREQLSRIERGELTIAELSREMQIDQSVVRRWKQLIERGSTTAVAANEDVVPASELRAALHRVRELSSARSVRFDALARQSTMRRENTSITNATYTTPRHFATYVKSATQS